MRQRREEKKTFQDSGRARVKSQRQETAEREQGITSCWKIICVPPTSQGGFKDRRVMYTSKVLCKL